MKDLDDLRLAQSIGSNDEQELRPALFISFEGKAPKILWVLDRGGQPTIRYISTLTPR